MRTVRIYHPSPLQLHQTIQLTAEASHHLARVLRASLATPLQLFDGQGNEHQVRIVAITKQAVSVKVEKCLAITAESPLQIHLGQCITRGEKMDYIIQKAVELGVHKITLLMSEFSAVKLNAERTAKRLAHWQAVIINACEQSGRNYVPEITAPILLHQWLTQTQAELKLILHPQFPKRLADFSSTASNIAITIGPEGGFSDTEIQQAHAAGFYALTLGPRILRTETAGPATITALQTKWGDLA